jgi:hypothetical protein
MLVRKNPPHSPFFKGGSNRFPSLKKFEKEGLGEEISDFTIRRTDNVSQVLVIRRVHYGCRK